MANRYWVGNAGTWNTTSTTNWSATSGGAAGASAPTSADNVFFDNNSGSPFFVVTLGASVSVNNLTITGVTSTLTISGSTQSISVWGNLTVDSTSLVSLSILGLIVGANTAGSGTSTLTSGGYTFPCRVSFGLTSASNTVTLADNFACTGAQVTFNGGVLNLSNRTVTCNYFVSTSTTTARQIQFGTGSITSTNVTTPTPYCFNIVGTNFTYTGSGQLYATYVGGAKRIEIITGWTETNALSLSVTLSAIADTYTSSATAFKNFTTTGTGVFYLANGNNTFYGDFTLSSTTTWNAGYAVVFGATSGTKSITTNGVSVGANITVNGAGGTFYLGSALTCAGTLTLWAGTFNANNYNVTCYNFVGDVTTSVRALTMGSGTWTLNGSTNGSWSVAATNMTLTANTSTIKMSASISKGFTGGGFTYYILDQASSPELLISSSNTFNTINNTYAGATTIRFSGLTTQTVTNFTATGTSGNVLTLLSSSSGLQWTLSKSSGQVLLDYVSITDGVATGGARFYAGVHSTNGGNNTGWIFSSPSAGTNGFFRLFPI